jgi:hypothetical protein
MALPLDLSDVQRLCDRPWRIRADEAARQLRTEPRASGQVYTSYGIVVAHEIALALADIIAEASGREWMLRGALRDAMRVNWEDPNDARRLGPQFEAILASEGGAGPAPDDREATEDDLCGPSEVVVRRDKATGRIEFLRVHSSGWVRKLCSISRTALAQDLGLLGWTLGRLGQRDGDEAWVAYLRAAFPNPPAE